MITVELVAYDPDKPETYPSVCVQADEVRARYGFEGGEMLVFNKHGSYVGQLSKQTAPLEWKVEHATSCPVTRARAALAADLAMDPLSKYLLGAVPEYDEGGDQEVELCECHVGGDHVQA